MERAQKELLKTDSTTTVRELQGAVVFAMDLLVKLPKLKPEDEREDAGVEVLRAAMSDPAKVVDRLIANPKFIAALKAKGWLPPPARPHHRPTKDQIAERDAYEARQRDEEDQDDDGELRRQLAAAGKPQ